MPWRIYNMPNDKIAIHPSGAKIVFNEENHSYIDDYNIAYNSVTKVIHNAFPQFNAQDVAKKVAQRDGLDMQNVLNSWKMTGQTASINGTRMHENCERQILNRLSEMHTPNDEDERIRFKTAWYKVKELQNEFINLSPEMIVFSPYFNVAGSIDLLAKKNDYNYSILDYKVVKEIKKDAFNNQKGLTYATFDLPNANFFLYALQLNIYEFILKFEKYIPYQATVNKELLKYNINGSFDRIKLPDLQFNALLLLTLSQKDNPIIPF